MSHLIPQRMSLLKDDCLWWAVPSWKL